MYSTTCKAAHTRETTQPVLAAENCIFTPVIKPKA